MKKPLVQCTSGLIINPGGPGGDSALLAVGERLD